MSMFGMGDAFDYMIMQEDKDASELYDECKMALEAGRDPQLIMYEVADAEPFEKMSSRDRQKIINLLVSYM